MPTTTDNPVIDVRALVHRFGDATAVDGIDLHVRPGEMFGLVGPDGAGKSTMIRLLCGILKASGGEGRVLGYDLRTQSAEIKTRIGYLSQQFTLYGDLTVNENVEFFAALHGVRDFRRRREELLAFTRLAPFRDRLAQALSGGMKKKLALACTLIHMPRLILLDEPSTGVDPVSRGEFWSILSGILAQGVTIVMTTPYLDEADRCHRVGLMFRGKLLLTGTPGEVKAALPGCMVEFTCADARGAYHALRTTWPCERLVLYGDRVRVWAQQGESEKAELTRALNRAGYGDVEVRAVSPSLEDAFVALVEQGGERS